MSYTVVGDKPQQGPTAEGQYCIAIGTGANIDGNACGEILIANLRKASLRMLMDGTIEVCGRFVGVDKEVYRWMRSLIGGPAPPDLPNIPEVPYIFKGPDYTAEENEEIENAFKMLSQVVAIGYKTKPVVSGEIIFGNRYGYEFRIKPDQTVFAGNPLKMVGDHEILGCLRELFCIDNNAAVQNAKRESIAEAIGRQVELERLTAKITVTSNPADQPPPDSSRRSILKASGFQHSEDADLWVHSSGVKITGIEIALPETTQKFIELIKSKLAGKV